MEPDDAVVADLDRSGASLLLEVPQPATELMPARVMMMRVPMSVLREWLMGEK